MIGLGNEANNTIRHNAIVVDDKSTAENIHSSTVDLINIPIGILVCAPVKNGDGSSDCLQIEYSNEVAEMLLGFDPSTGKNVLLNQIPYLNSFIETAFSVIDSGVSFHTKSQHPQTGSWIQTSIHKSGRSCTVYLQEVRQQILYEQELQRRLQLGAILAEISFRLICVNPEQLDFLLGDCLQEIGLFNGADRVYIFNYTSDCSLMSCTHEWCAADIEPQQAVLQNESTSCFPWWHDTLVNQETLLLQSLNELPLYAIAEKESLIAQGIKSVLVVPLFSENKLTGFVGFDSVKKERNWDKNDIDLLNTFAGLISATNSRIQHLQELQRTNDRLKGINLVSKALLTSSLSEERPALVALKHLYRMIPCEKGIVFSLEESTLIARADSQIRFGNQEDSTVLRLPTSYLQHPLLARGHEVRLNNLEAGMSLFVPDFDPHQRGYRSFLAIPLVAHQQVIGILVLLDRKPDFFSSEHVLIGQDVANQLSFVMIQESVNQQLRNQSNQATESNVMLKEVIDNTPFVIALCKPVLFDGKIIDFVCLLTNSIAQSITGLSQEELVSQSLTTLFPNFFTNGLFEKLIHVFETGETQQLEFKENTSIEEIWTDLLIVKVGYAILFTARDISHHKKNEEALGKSNTLLELRLSERSIEVKQLSAIQRAIFSYAGLGIAATDTKGIIQLINPALAAMTGFEPAELIGKCTPGALRDPDIHSYQIDQLKLKMQGSTLLGEELVTAYVQKHNYLRRENTLLTKKGKKMPVISTVSGLFDDQEELIGFVDIVIDISYLKTIERELVHTAQRSQLATKAGKFGLWEWNLRSKKLILDEYFYAFFDLPNQNRIRHIDDLKRIIHPEESVFFDQFVQKVITSKKPFDIEFRVVLPITNEIHYIRLDGHYIESEMGQDDRIIGVVRDRTAKRQSELALSESEKRYRSLVNHLNEVVFQTDVNGLWTFLNPAWYTITGFTVDESMGKLFLEYVLPDDQAINQEQFTPLITRQKVYCRHIVRYIHKEGGYRWIEVFAQLTLNEQNEVIGTTGTLTDITERKKSEETILESEQRFREIAEKVDEIFWIRDVKEPRFLYMNPTYEKFSGQSVQHLYTKPELFLNFVIEQDRAFVERALSSNESNFSFQFQAHHQDGSIRWLNARLFMIKDEAGVLIRRIGVASDITTNIEKELILNKSLEKERALNALKSQFISTASHEFRTPLAGISLSAELIKHYIELGSVETVAPLIKRHVDTITSKVFSLNDLIVDTLTISKIEEGKVAVKLVPSDLVEFCQTLIGQNFAEREDKRQVIFTVTGEPVQVYIDLKLMHHVITNLISNALKFSTTNPKLEILYKLDGAVILSVKDEGIGIPTGDCENIFGKFFRASNAKTVPGTGLGLAICQEYIALQNGLITFASIEGKGTTFQITLSSQSKH